MCKSTYKLLAADAMMRFEISGVGNEAASSVIIPSSRHGRTCIVITKCLAVVGVDLLNDLNETGQQSVHLDDFNTSAQLFFTIHIPSP